VVKVADVGDGEGKLAAKPVAPLYSLTPAFFRSAGVILR